MICIPSTILYLVCISDTDNMCTINLYTYHPCTICVHILFVCILSVSDMRTRAGGTHIGHGQYAYTFIVRISDTDDMRTRAGSTHIVCVRYAYYLLWCAYWTQTICIQINVYAYRLCPICAPEQVVRMLDMDDMHTNNNIYRHIFMCGNWTISSDCTPN